jgi:O-antigen/teichoic acid export membrane protein
MCGMKVFKLIAGSVFLRQNAILLVGAVAVGFLNYLFYPVIGRLLDPVSFGEVQAIFSLFLQLTIFLTVLSMVTVFIVANYKNARLRNRSVLELEKIAVWIAAGFLLVSVLSADWFKNFFKFDSAWPFILLAVLLVVSVPFTFRTAFLRGRKNFIASVIANLLTAGGRFVFALPLVILGMGAVGALVGVAIGQAVALAYAAFQSSKAGLARPDGMSLLSRPRLNNLLPEIKYSAYVFAGSLAITLQLSIDILVVKHLFDEHTAGLYAGIITVARTIFFLTTPIVMALLPMIKVEASLKVNNAHLLKSLALFFAIGTPLLLVMLIFPTETTKLLMSSQYVEVANLLPLLALTTFTTSLLNVVVSYFLALKRYISGMLVIIGFAVTFGLMLFHHGSLQAVVETLFIGSMVSICLIGIWVTRARLTSRRSIDETTSSIHRGPGAQ